MATEHLHACVARLRGAIGGVASMRPTKRELAEATHDVLDLIDLPWDKCLDRDVLTWREGYETCMKDIVDAMADRWGVDLPEDPLRTKESHDGGEQR